jgi:hypothetical protein
MILDEPTAHLDPGMEPSLRAPAAEWTGSGAGRPIIQYPYQGDAEAAFASPR